jgi:predicted transcriptional regulator YdeE
MPEGRYVVFTYEGAVAALEAYFRNIYSCWFPTSSLVPDDFTAYQRYVGDEPENGLVRLEIWLRTRPRH